MSDKRQKNQLQRVLAFTGEGRSEAPKAPREGTESLTANCATESPAGEEQLMEEVCGRENCQQALRRVKANKGQHTLQAIALNHALRRGPALWSAVGQNALQALGLPPYSSQRRTELQRLYVQLQKRKTIATRFVVVRAEKLLFIYPVYQFRSTHPAKFRDVIFLVDALT